MWLAGISAANSSAGNLGIMESLLIVFKSFLTEQLGILFHTDFLCFSKILTKLARRESI